MSSTASGNFQCEIVTTLSGDSVSSSTASGQFQCVIGTRLTGFESSSASGEFQCEVSATLGLAGVSSEFGRFTMFAPVCSATMWGST